MSDLPPLTEETAPPGTALKGYERTITRDDVAAFVGRTGETLDDYVVGGEATVPAGMLMGLYGPLSHGTFHYEACVHVSSELELDRVPRLDEPIRVEGRVLDLFEKNGNKYVTFSVEVSTLDGERLATVAHTSIYALRRKVV
jgi:acyl-coenzyme A thioesterase PaaI-like protein